jgi:hypothetical protein
MVRRLDLPVRRRPDCRVATLPYALIPAFNGMGWNLANSLHNQRIVAIIFGVRLVALINNTGVIFEILGMVVFAFILALFHNH